MASRWSSVFSDANCSFPYFVVTGLTTDNIINDELIISDVKRMLHRHLVAQGFDAVVFFDPVHMLHFYDTKTSFIVRNSFVPTQQQLNKALTQRNPDENPPAPHLAADYLLLLQNHSGSSKKIRIMDIYGK